MTREQAMQNLNGLSTRWADAMKRNPSEYVFDHYYEIANECQLNYRLTTEAECNWPEAEEGTSNPVVCALMRSGEITDAQYRRMVQDMSEEGLSPYTFDMEDDLDFYARLIKDATGGD